MTLAICIKCGAEKIGALTPCIRCSFDPQNPEDQAKSIMLSDHNMAAADLRNVSIQMQEGKQITFDEAELKEMSDERGSMDIKKIEAETGRFFSNCFLIVVVVVVGIIGLSWLIFKW